MRLALLNFHEAPFAPSARGGLLFLPKKPHQAFPDSKKEHRFLSGALLL